MEEENKIYLTDLLYACIEFKKNPVAENEQEISSILKKMQVRKYMPLREKQIATALILNCAGFIEGDLDNPKVDATDVAVNMEAGKTIYGILSYVVNLDNDLGNQALDFSVYDTLYQFGVIDYVLSYCKEDYKRLLEIVNCADNFSHINDITKTVSLVSTDKMQQFIHAVKSITTDLDQKKLDSLKEIMNTQDPSWSLIKQTVGDTALSKARDKELSKLDDGDKNK